MTTLGAWISYTNSGLDQTVATALHVVSDSRITWGSQSRRWDAGRKLFVPYEEPHILGYCGDVVFPGLVLGQITSAIDQKILFAADATPAIKHDTIFNSIRTSWAGRHNTPDASFQILHAMRKTAWPDPSFALWKIECRAANDSWNSVEIPIGGATSKLIWLGSGTQSAGGHALKWGRSDVGGTSRSIFSAFHDAIESGEEPG
jgi:hypothetical protein